MPSAPPYRSAGRSAGGRGVGQGVVPGSARSEQLLVGHHQLGAGEAEDAAEATAPPVQGDEAPVLHRPADQPDLVVRAGPTEELDALAVLVAPEEGDRRVRRGGLAG